MGFVSNINKFNYPLEENIMKINYNFWTVKFIAIFSLGSLGIIAPLKPTWAGQTNQSNFTGSLTYHFFTDVNFEVQLTGGLNRSVEVSAMIKKLLKLGLDVDIDYKIDANGKVTGTYKVKGDTKVDDFEAPTQLLLNQIMKDAMDAIKANLGIINKINGMTLRRKLENLFALLPGNSSTNITINKKAILSNKTSFTKQEFDTLIDILDQQVQEFNIDLNSLFLENGLNPKAISQTKSSVKKLQESLQALTKMVNTIPNDSNLELINAKKETLNSVSDMISVLELTSRIMQETYTAVGTLE